jgi:hypothetical protein
MNDRIRELEKQCWNYQGNHIDAEKFAKLLIEECASLFYLTHTDEQYPRRIDKTIRKHFGVES